MVDLVFKFDEDDNNKNISLLEPDLYFKAGDYKIEQLSSAKIVQSYGGEVRIIPFEKGKSSTEVINAAVDSFVLENMHDIKKEAANSAPALFFDRDGTIVKDVPYLHDIEKLELLDGVAETLKLAQDKGYRLIMVSNQPGIGFGYFSKEQFYLITKELLKKISAKGVLIDKIYFCPHSKADRCECRKPAIEFAKRAQK